MNYASLLVFSYIQLYHNWEIQTLLLRSRYARNINSTQPYELPCFASKYLRLNYIKADKILDKISNFIIGCHFSLFLFNLWHLGLMLLNNLISLRPTGHFILSYMRNTIKFVVRDTRKLWLRSGDLVDNESTDLIGNCFCLTKKFRCYSLDP